MTMSRRCCCSDRSTSTSTFHVVPAKYCVNAMPKIRCQAIAMIPPKRLLTRARRGVRAASAHMVLLLLRVVFSLGLGQGRVDLGLEEPVQHGVRERGVLARRGLRDSGLRLGRL